MDKRIIGSDGSKAGYHFYDFKVRHKLTGESYFIGHVFCRSTIEAFQLARLTWNDRNWELIPGGRS